MEISDFINQLLKLKEKDVEQKAWEFWIVQYPHFTKETFVPFNEFLNSIKQKEVKEDVQLNGVYVDQCFF